MKNIRIKMKLLEVDKRQWWLADLMGISEATFTRKFRYELPEEEQDRLIQLIEENADKQNDNEKR